MKPNYLYSTLAILAAVFMLSSCAFLQKSEFAQRKYYDFPRTKHTVEGNTSTASVKASKDITEGAVKQENENKPSSPVLASNSEKGIVLDKPLKTVKVKQRKETSTINTLAGSPAISFKKADIRKEAIKVLPHVRFIDAGGYLIIEIIAAIFFPPLAIFLKDHKTNKWFWWTLILCILGGGFYLGLRGVSAVGGLLWAIAVIIAFLNIFDVI